MSRSHLSRRLLAAAAAVSITGVLTACGSDVATQTGDPSAAAPGTASAAASAPASAPAGETIAIDNWVITSFPIPAGLTVEFTQPSGPDQGSLVMTFTAGTTTEDVFDFYADALKADGYTVDVIPDVSVSFSGKGVSGDVIKGDPPNIVITKD